MNASLLFPTLLIAAALGGVVYMLSIRLEERSTVRATLADMNSWDRNRRDPALEIG